MTRIAYANLGAEEREPVPRFEEGTGIARLAKAFADVVEAPPWSWLEEMEGLVPWLSTPYALRMADRRSVKYAGCDPAIVARVHDKAFAVRHAGGEPPPAVIDDARIAVERINDIVRSWPDWARRNFTVKPRFGTSGRGRVRGKDGAVVHQGEIEMRGGAVVEPWLHRAWDLSSQWFIDEHGEPHHLGNTLQSCKPSGVYVGCEIVMRGGRFTSSVVRGGHDFDDELTERTRPLVEAAAKEGYRGPCGVDGFTWRDDDGVEHLRPIVELNARFTAGTIALALATRLDMKDGARAVFRLTDDTLVTLQ